MASEIHLRDEDRLPWLETVEPDEPDEPGAGRVLAFVVLGLLVLAALVFAVYKLGNRAPAVAPGAGEGAVIAAPSGDYKIKPGDPGGLKLGGEGDAAIATSTGTGANGARIDTRQVPEKPVAATHGATAPAHAVTPVAGAKVVSAVPSSGGRLTAAPPMAAPHAAVPGATTGGTLVQLGAFPTEAKANQAWSNYAKRFGYLATLGKVVEPAKVGERNVFRLRVNAGSSAAASDLCGRLKVAGEDCFVATG